jgi:hypothetical protein
LSVATHDEAVSSAQGGDSRDSRSGDVALDGKSRPSGGAIRDRRNAFHGHNRLSINSSSQQMKQLLFLLLTPPTLQKKPSPTRAGLQRTSRTAE